MSICGRWKLSNPNLPKDLLDRTPFFQQAKGSTPKVQVEFSLEECGKDTKLKIQWWEDSILLHKALFSLRKPNFLEMEDQELDIIFVRDFDPEFCKCKLVYYSHETDKHRR